MELEIAPVYEREIKKGDFPIDSSCALQDVRACDIPYHILSALQVYPGQHLAFMFVEDEEGYTGEVTIKKVNVPLLPAPDSLK